MGVGRENITGVMPLYLFKEHWEIARRKAPPIYGFLCTLDIMGYASSQYFTVPFLVLLKAIDKANDEGTQVYKMIRDMVLETCKVMLKSNEEFRKNTIKMIKDFYESPEQRTADVVASIPVFSTQLYTLLQIENVHEEYLKDQFSIDREKLQVIFRFALEEQMRRGIKSDAEPLTKSLAFKLLYPDYDTMVSEVMLRRTQEINEELDKSPDSNVQDVMLPYKAQAQIFRNLDKVQEPQEEVK